jgi:hypothetical protein
MDLTDDDELSNTERKLRLIEDQIQKARARSGESKGRSATLRSLVQTANQLKEEIVRYRSRQRFQKRAV